MCCDRKVDGKLMDFSNLAGKLINFKYTLMQLKLKNERKKENEL